MKSSVPLHLGVFVLTPSAEVFSKGLGEYAPIRGAALAFRQALAAPGSYNYISLAHNLYGLLINPIAEKISTFDHWRLAPDHELLIIPFDALVTPGKKFLADERQITYLGSGASLASEVGERELGADVVIMAAPAFDGGERRSAQPSPADTFLPQFQQFLSAVSEQGAPLQFTDLLGALDEGKRIGEIFPNSQLLVGEEATEGHCKTLRSPGILHIATHGFYLNDDLIATQGVRGLKRVKTEHPPGIEEKERSCLQASWIGRRSLDHPLLNCGLAFSGSNQLYDGKNDGILTGMEVLGMDLEGTSLVVLSACETGVGEVLNGQGVMGMRQAFEVAGASSIVMSLWKVSDEAMAQLMERFYQELK
jgi:CHAT domain-containing protein